MSRITKKMVAEMQLRAALIRQQRHDKERDWIRSLSHHPTPQWEPPKQVQPSNLNKPQLELVLDQPEQAEPPRLEPVDTEIVQVLSDDLAQFREMCTRKFPALSLCLTKYGQGQWLAATLGVFEHVVRKRNWQVVASTGAGKTFVQGGVILMTRTLCPERFPYNKFWIMLTPKAVVDQTMQVFTLPVFEKILLSTLIKSLPSMGAGFGDAFLEWRTVVQNSEPVMFPFWRPNMYPCEVTLDESQMVKNEDSDASKIVLSCSYSGIPMSFYSATPYSRPCQTRTIACALQPEIEIAGSRTMLTPQLFPAWVRARSAPHNPVEWSPAALRSVQKDLEPQTIRFTCKYPHKLLVKLAACRFRSPQSYARYQAAFDEWQQIREERGKNPLVGMAQLLVAIQKFNQVAEEERVEPQADYGLALFREREQFGKLKPAIIFGFAHKTSLDMAYEYVRQRIDPKLISLIYGGQTDTARSREVGRFKSDRAPILLMTLACGGAGLSLHHSPTNSRQRYSLASFVWNDIQQAQFAGRTQRINSQSASYLILLYYEGTEEARKVHKMKHKLRTLREVITPVQGEGGFVDDIDDVETVHAGTLSEDQEDLAANRLIGTQDSHEVELVED